MTEEANDLGDQTKRTRRVGHVRCDGQRGVQIGFGKKTFRKTRRRWEESVKRDLREIEWCM
jgi:hypothetical protein